MTVVNASCIVFSFISSCASAWVEVHTNQIDTWSTMNVEEEHRP